MPSKWVQHVKSVYAKGKSKGMSYKQAMIAAKSSYKKSAKGSEEPEAASPKRKGRKKKKREESRA